jgi:hypothetical protein
MVTCHAEGVTAFGVPSRRSRSAVSDPASFHPGLAAAARFPMPSLVVSGGCTAFEQRLSRLPLADLHWPLFPTRIYGDDAILTEVDGPTWVWITARDVAAFDRTLQIAEDAGICWESLERPH